jgi:hypothetical protein
MSVPVTDELGWNLGESSPELYANCLWLWGSLGDLVNDSADPINWEAPNDGNPPPVDRFIIYQEDDIFKRPISNEKIGRFGLYILFGSWVHVTFDSEGRSYSERRFVLEKLEENVFEGSRTISRKEMLVGLGCVARTEFFSDRTKEESPPELCTQTYELDENLIKVMNSFMRRVPNSKLERKTAQEKRTTREAAYVDARAFQSIDPSEIDLDALGNPMLGSTPLRKIVERLRSGVDIANNLRFKKFYGQRLFDFYRSRYLTFIPPDK